MKIDAVALEDASGVHVRVEVVDKEDFWTDKVFVAKFRSYNKYTRARYGLVPNRKHLGTSVCVNVLYFDCESKALADSYIDRAISDLRAMVNSYRIEMGIQDSSLKLLRTVI